MRKALEELRKVHYIPVSVIDANISAVRQFFEQDKLKEMAASIKEKGVLQSIIVRPKKDDSSRFDVVVGMRRLRSALLAGQKEVPCVIDQVDDKEALELGLTENIQREDLTPFEEGLAILKLIKEFGYSQKKVCKKLGKNDIYVRTRLKLLALPETIQKAVIQEKLSISQAAPLAELSTSEEQEKAAREIISSSLTGHDVKELVAMKRKRAMGRADSSRAKIWIWKELDLHARKVIEILADTESPTKFSFGNREDLEVILLKLKKAIEKTLRQLKDASQED